MPHILKKLRTLEITKQLINKQLNNLYLKSKKWSLTTLKILKKYGAKK